MKLTSGRTNYLIQSNYFTKSILKDVTEIQKDIIYFLQSQINFSEENPTGTVVFNYDKFLQYKNIEIQKNTYSPKEILSLCEGLITINGAFYNKQTSSTVFFTLFDNVEVSELDPKEFIITFANYGKIFFYEKFAIEYAKSSKIQYTQIESSIIDLKGEKRKKFFEILSQYKSTGFYRVSVEELKTLLGFIVYKERVGEASENIQLQLRLLFTGEENEDYERQEYLKSWSEFKRVFLDPAIEEFNNNSKLDISNISYETIRTGRKITGLHFTFQKKLTTENLSLEMENAIKYFKNYGLTEKQVLFLLQRIGYKVMFSRLNEAITFNNKFDDKNSQFYHKKVWFENSTGNEIKNLGGYLYEKVFPELK